MIGRILQARVYAKKARALRELLVARPIPDCRSAAGNLRVQILERGDGEVAHFKPFTFWERLDSIRGFAGADIATATCDLADVLCLTKPGQQSCTSML